MTSVMVWVIAGVLHSKSDRVGGGWRDAFVSQVFHRLDRRSACAFALGLCGWPLGFVLLGQ
jgi:hypothetical protein